MPVEIVPATFRDLSYIAAHIRPDDRAECEAQLGPLDSMELAAAHLRDFAFVALVDGNPEAGFGACRILGDHLWAAWSWGTPRIGKAVPTIIRHARRVMIPEIYALGFSQRVEARALDTNVMAHRWLKSMGATERCVLPNYGMSGEAFRLFDWTRDDYDVHLQPQD